MIGSLNPTSQHLGFGGFATFRGGLMWVGKTAEKLIDDISPVSVVNQLILLFHFS